MNLACIQSQRPMQQAQQGAVLVTGLIILVVMTLLVLGLVRTAILQLKIGGANQVYVSNLETAQTSIDQYIAAYSGSRRFTADCDKNTNDPAQDQRSCQLLTTSFRVRDIGTGAKSVRFFPITDNIAINVEQTACLPSGARGSGTAVGQGASSVYFNINAQTSSAFFGGRSKLDQGVMAKNSAEACNTV